jgi:hypothetical protein
MKLKQIIRAVSIFSILFLVTSCSAIFNRATKGSGNVVIQDIKVGVFSEIEMGGVFNIILSQGTKEAVSIEADDNLLDLITAKVSEKKLIIDFKSGELIRDYTKLNVFITLVDINKLYANCVGNVSAPNPLSLESLILESSGVGDLNLVLDCNDLTIDKSGVGDITLSGQTNNFTINSSGVGDILALELDSKNVVINTSGVGDVQVNAGNSIDVNTSGVGDVEFIGDPRIEKINKNGVGNVDKI